MSSRSKSPARTAAASAKDDEAPPVDFRAIISAAWRRCSFLEKVSLLVTIAMNMPLFIIGGIWQKLRHGGRDNVPNGPLHSVAPRIWQFVYWGGQSTTTVIQGKDGGLLVHLPGPPQADTLAQLAKIGRVKLVWTSESHNTYGDVWAKKFGAKLIAPVSPCRGIRSAVATLDDPDVKRELKDNFGVTTVDVCDAVEMADAIFNIQVADKKVALLCCGVGNQNLTVWSPISLYVWLAGFGGLRTFRQFCLIFCKDLGAFQKHLRATRDASLVLFQHGPPLKNAALMGDIVASRSLLSIAWPFSR